MSKSLILDCFGLLVLTMLACFVFFIVIPMAIKHIRYTIEEIKKDWTDDA